jgi:hypothetical protein
LRGIDARPVAPHGTRTVITAGIEGFSPTQQSNGFLLRIEQLQQVESIWKNQLKINQNQVMKAQTQTGFGAISTPRTS